MTSRTYQESSTFVSPSNAKIDPENRYFWKMPLQRLEGDAIRDSILFVSGGLNPQAGGPGVFPEIDAAQADSIPKGALYQSWPPSKDGPEVWRRSVYVIQRRSVTPPILDLFDPPDSITSCPRRNATTVAPQALQLLNNKFVARQATIFADRVIDEVGADQTAEVQEAFALALSRPPRPAELKLTLDFLKRQTDFHRNQARSLLEQGVDPAQILAPEQSGAGGRLPFSLQHKRVCVRQLRRPKLRDSKKPACECCQPRRKFLWDLGGGIAGLALVDILSRADLLASTEPATSALPP